MQMRSIVTDRVAWSVCRSVTVVNNAKTAQLIEMPFGLRTRVGPRNHVLDGRGQIAACEGAIFTGKDMRGHAWQDSAVQKNGWTDRDAVCVVDSGGPKKACISCWRA